MTLHILFPTHFNGERTSYTCMSFAQHMASADLDVIVHAPSSSGAGRAYPVEHSLPWNAGRYLSRLSSPLAAQLTSQRLLRQIRPGDAVYLWGNIETALLHRLRGMGVTIYREKFNCLAAASKEVLDQVYERLGRPPNHELTDEHVEREMDQLKLVDYIFVANPVSEQKYYEFGIPAEKILFGPYGWDPQRLCRPAGHQRLTDAPFNDAPFNVVFAGVAAIRKGIDLLLDAWVAAGVEGTFTIAGTVAPEVQDLCAASLARDDVIVTGWLDNPAAEYWNADVFVFPTHDEGGPLVTYEAMGCGLPAIVSPVGAGAITTHGVDGFVIDPYDVGAWADAIRMLAGDREQRLAMGAAAAVHAKEFTWDRVGAIRRDAVLTCESVSDRRRKVS